MKIRITLCADEGKILTDGVVNAHMVNLYDTMDISDWMEVDDIE